MAKKTLLHLGAFIQSVRDAINDNFTELYAAVKLGTGSITATTISGTTGTFTGAVTGINISKTNLCTVQFDAVTSTTGVTLTNVTGLSQSVAVGTYKFRAVLYTTSTANTGIKVGFKLTTAVISAIAALGNGMIAAGSASQKTATTTDQTLLFDTAAGVEIGIVVEGIAVFSTAGTFGLQAAQHTAHADTTSVLVNSYLEMTRIA